MTDNTIPEEYLIREADLAKENQCLACARKCKLFEGARGFCGVRGFYKGKLWVLNYGRFIAFNLDPIEKKPLYHFYPGNVAFSLGTTGCSWACKYCINYDISQRRKIEGVFIPPEELLEIVKSYKEKLNLDTAIVTFTYNEPSIYAEYSYDFAKLAKKEGIKITWVSNGYLTDEAIDYAAKFLDAITIDFKGNGNNEFARKYISIPSYEPVFQAVEELYKKGVHVEITDLVVPKVGDNLEDARKLAKFIYDVMGEESNIHFLRFHPMYKMKDLPPTDVETLEKHAQVAKEEGVTYVYIGNVPGHHLENTYCPKCGYPVIKRYGFEVYEVNLTEDNRCPKCGYKLPIIGKARKSILTFPIPLL